MTDFSCFFFNKIQPERALYKIYSVKKKGTTVFAQQQANGVQF